MVDKNKPPRSYSRPKLRKLVLGLKLGLALGLIYWLTYWLAGLLDKTNNPIIIISLPIYASFLLWLGLALILINRYRGRRRSFRSLVVTLNLSRPEPKTIGQAIIVALTTLIFLNIVMIGLDWLGLVDADQRQVIFELVPSNSWGLVWFCLTVCLLVPITEEIIFRRWLCKSLSLKIGFGPALILSSLLFGLGHFETNAPAAAILTAMLGIVWGSAYHRWQNLWVPISMHMTTNILSIGVWVLSN